MFYVPNIPFALYHALKAKNLVFYTAVNPTIENSGIGTESKFKTMQLIPEKYLPITIFHKANSDCTETINKINQSNISYPLIAKPDVGFRGLLVKKIASENELKNYLEKYPIDILIQEFLTEQNECGIFYLRFPDNQSGKITSITLKEFLHVVGDGKHTLKELVILDKRAKNYLEIVKMNAHVSFNAIIKNGERVQLSDIGNHSKGTQFINGNHLISKKLEETITLLNKQVNGWFYGRIDIKYNSFEELENGIRKGFNTLTYTTPEIHRIGKVAMDLAGKRDKRVCSIDKANVLETTVMWREEMTKIGASYPDIELSHMYVDNAAMQLVRNPKQFDVVVTTNMFGDILSDCAAMLTGSLGMLPSASLGAPDSDGKQAALYEPVHGTAPDISGKGIANPLAQILSFSMLLRYSFDLFDDAELIEKAVQNALDKGFRTADITGDGKTLVSTSGMGDAVINELDMLAA